MVEIYIPEGRGKTTINNPNFTMLTANDILGSQSQPISVEEEIKGEGENMEVPLP